MKDYKEEIKLVKSIKELLENIVKPPDKKKLTGYEIGSLIKSFLQDNQDSSDKFLIKLQSQVVYKGNKKPSLLEIKNKIIKLERKIKKLEVLSNYTIEIPEDKPPLVAKLDLYLKLKTMLFKKNQDIRSLL